MDPLQTYYTVIVPFVPEAFRTEWHPTTPEGPFSTLSRGAFPTYDGAVAWGKAHLNGTPYSIQKVES